VGWSPCGRWHAAWVGLALLIGLAGCGSDQTATPLATEPVSETVSETVSQTPSPTLTPNVQTPAPAPTPHRGVIAVVDVVHVASAETGRRVFAMLLKGEAGSSAVLRSLQIRAWMEPIDGSSCQIPPVPTVLHPNHQDAVQPTLADQTRTVVVRSRGHSEEDAGARSSASFRYGPVPSLNGDFEGWVSFHFPADADEGFCAFDLRGVVVVVAGETTTAELPVVRIDTRDRPDGP
jgi:hypothetical protein